MPPRRRHRRLVSRKLLISLGISAATAVIVPLAVIIVLMATIDAGAYRLRLEAVLRDTLGHDVRIRGPVSIAVSSWLAPKIEIDDIALVNVPGWPHADLVRVEHMTVDLAPWTLFSGTLSIQRVALVKPDILLETDASGRANWRAQPGSAGGSAARGLPRDVPLLALLIRDGRIIWRDGKTGASGSFDIRRMSLTSSAIDAPVVATAELYSGRQRVNVSAQVGPWARLFDIAAKTPWGLFANFESGGAKLTVSGALTRPNELRGYSLRLDATAPDLAQLGWLIPGRLPPLRAVALSARLLDTGLELPDVSALLVQAGFSNLDKVTPGLSIGSLRIEMQRMTEPVSITVEGAYASAPLRISGSIGAPSLLLADAPAGVGYNVDIAIEAAGAALAARGAIGNPGHGTGMDIALGGRIPDLAPLGPLLGVRLPQLKSLTFTGTLADGAGGYRQEITFRDIVLTAPQGDIAGEVALSRQGRPAVRATLKSGALDTDGLLAAWSGAGTDDTPVLREGRPGPRDIMAAPAVPRRIDTVIANTALPLEGLQAFDADIRANVDQLKAFGAPYRDVGASIVLSNRRLLAGPITAEMGNGHAELQVSIDARQPIAAVGVAGKSRSVDLRPYLAGWGLHGVSVQRADLDVDIKGSGATWHDLAGSLDGHVALLLRDGALDTTVARGMIADVLRGVRAGDAHIAMRCLSLGLDVSRGQVTLSQAGIDTAGVLGTASGTINLGDETMAVLLSPSARNGEAIVAMPVKLEGGWVQPRFTRDQAIAGRAPSAPVEPCPVSPFLRGVP